MELLCTFGFALARLINKNDAVGVGLVSLAIREAGKEIKGIQDISYQEFRSIIQIQLAGRLEKMNVPNHKQVVANMLRVVEEQQSLFTMSAH